MTYRECDPDEPMAHEMSRGRAVVITALRENSIDPNLVPSILVGLLCADAKRRPMTREQRLRAIDEYAAYMRAAISAHHMVEEFFGSAR